MFYCEGLASVFRFGFLPASMSSPGARLPLRFANVLLLLASCLGAFLVAETALRLLGRGDAARITSTLDIFTPDPRTGYALEPDLSRVLHWNGKDVFIKTDSRGCRIPADPGFVAARGRRKLVFCGDSYVFGNEENAADTFVFLLGGPLDRDAVNLGVGGYSTFQSLHRLEGYLSETAVGPGDLVVLVFFVGNDFRDNLSANHTLDVDPRGRLRTAWGRRHRRLRDLIHRSHLLSLVALRARSAYLRWRYPSLGLRYAPIYAPGFYSERMLDRTRQALRRFRDQTAAAGVQFAVAILPDKDQLYKSFPDEAARRRPNNAAAVLLREFEVPFIDLLPPLLERRDEGLYNLTPTGHLSVRGHRAVAEILASFVDSAVP